MNIINIKVCYFVSSVVGSISIAVCLTHHSMCASVHLHLTCFIAALSLSFVLRHHYGDDVFTVVGASPSE